MKYRFLGIVTLLLGATAPVGAQRLLSLDSCRALALRNNKQLQVQKVKQDVAAHMRRSARTKYLPHISAVGGYMHTTEEVSILNDHQKTVLGGLGTMTSGLIGQSLTGLAGQLPESLTGLLGQLGMSPEALQQLMTPELEKVAAQGNGLGQGIADALRTDTRNIWAGSVALVQPVFMGGAIVALNKMADIGEELTRNQTDQQLQNTLYTIDQAYWTVVSLKHKKKLAEAYLELVKKLDGDVEKMISEGVATRSQGLSVDVKVNEAEMQLTQVNDGLVLSRMLLCQLCGLELNEAVVLADEDVENLSISDVPQLPSMEQAIKNRPEMRMLENTINLSRQATNLLKAGNLPQVALVGGYTTTNPSVLNGFEKKFRGMWNVGVLVRIPLWNWGDVAHKVRASKGLTTIATLEMNEAREKMELQINQSQFRVSEARKKLDMTRSNVRRADENLRMANLGFQEGVVESTTVMEAQTAWLQAQTQKIDAEINLKLSQVNLQKAVGTLGH